jgi:hypothetical protein
MIKYLHTKLDIDHIKTKKINKSKRDIFYCFGRTTREYKSSN